MLGGSQQAFQRAVPLLEPMSQAVVHCGPLGAGLAAKIANKLVDLSICRNSTYANMLPSVCYLVYLWWA